MSCIEIDFVLKTLHPKQDFIVKNARRFNHLRCGRRFGKTTLIEELCSITLSGKLVGVWFPTYKDLSEVWKDIKKTYNSVISRKDETLKQIELSTGGLMDFWSMDQPESGQGRKYHRAIIDEAAKAEKLYQSWENTIRPTLTDYRGDAFILSRPKGKTNGFYQLEEKHRKFANWAFYHFTTYDNPFIEVEEIEEARQQLDEFTFRQEYLAEYVDANDRPFLYAFSEKKHVVDSYVANPHLPIVVSFDFNRNPMTAIVGQQTDIRTLYIFDEVDLPDGSTEETCEIIRARYPGYQIEVTGDATGRSRTAMTRGNLNHYRIIRQELSLKDRDLRVRNANLAIRDSRVLCNSVLQNANVHIARRCEITIRDCAKAAVDEFGQLIKNEANPLHKFDSFRYLIDCIFADFITNPHRYQR
jgi:hypothetical protein